MAKELPGLLELTKLLLPYLLILAVVAVLLGWGWAFGLATIAVIGWWIWLSRLS